MIDGNSLMEYVVNNPKLVKMRECANYPGLFVLKYSKKVFYDMAKETMATHMPLDEWPQVLSNESNTGMTFMFECVHKNDPHIIPEKEGMHFLGWRAKAWEGSSDRISDLLEEAADIIEQLQHKGNNNVI